MPPTLASLVHHSALKLTVRAGEDRLDTPVRWAHVSELPDPVPYMEGGELLLVTAVKLEAEDSEVMRRYVRRLAGAGVVGLGFAIGVHYDDIPQALVDAAKEEGLPLLEVPRRTPFLAISKAVSAANAADQYRAVTAGFEAQRELTKAALSGDGPGDLLARLASHVKGWAALYDVSRGGGRRRARLGRPPRARLTADVERLRERPAPASSVVGGGGTDGDAEADDRVELQSLGAGRRVRAVLAVGTGAPLGTAEPRRALGDRAPDPDHRAVALPAGGRAAAGRGGAADAAGGRAGPRTGRRRRSVRGAARRPVPPPHRRAAAAEPEGTSAGGVSDPLQSLADAMESVALRAGEPVLVVPDGDRLVVLAADGGDAVDACLAHTEAERGDAGAHEPAGEDELVVGLSAPAGPIAAVGAYKQAEQALSVARRRGRAQVEREELAAGSVMQLLADDAVRSFADGMLRALREHDARAGAT